jgi:hypothetical protein
LFLNSCLVPCSQLFSKRQKNTNYQKIYPVKMALSFRPNLSSLFGSFFFRKYLGCSHTLSGMDRDRSCFPSPYLRTWTLVKSIYFWFFVQNSTGKFLFAAITNFVFLRKHVLWRSQEIPALSVQDSWPFGTDPDQQIHTFD